jgi:hypothetical protein
MPQLATATAVAENQARKKAKRSSSSSSSIVTIIRNSTDLLHQHAYVTLDSGGREIALPALQEKLRMLSVGC